MDGTSGSIAGIPLRDRRRIADRLASVKTPRVATVTLAAQIALSALLVTLSSPASAHGGVVLQDDLCFIQLGYLVAHFKIYLPDTRQHEDFCEDLPETGNGVFIMEYINEKLNHVPVDFRIVRNTTGMGRFTNWEDVVATGDLAGITVLHVPGAVQPDLFTAMYGFEEPGEFVGIVEVGPDADGETQRAVFPFTVGYTNYGFWPLVVLVLFVLQGLYLWNSGWIKRRRSAA